MVEIKNGKAVLKRGKKEIVLTDNEIFAVHKPYIMRWMRLTAETDFDIPEENSWEVAEKGYDLYSDGDGLTEYEAIQTAAEKFYDQYKKLENVKVGDHIICTDTYSHDYEEHELLVKSIETDVNCMSESNPKGITLYGEDLSNGDSEELSICAVSASEFIRIVPKPVPAFFFTFGSNEKFPYQYGYVIVRAESLDDAICKFRAKYPDRDPDSNTVNCAFYYTEQKWIHVRYSDQCHDIIE